MHESLCAEGKGVLSSSFPLFLPFSFLCNFSLVPGGQSSLCFFSFTLLCSLAFLSRPFPFHLLLDPFFAPLRSQFRVNMHTHTHTWMQISVQHYVFVWGCGAGQHTKVWKPPVRLDPQQQEGTDWYWASAMERWTFLTKTAARVQLSDLAQASIKAVMEFYRRLFRNAFIKHRKRHSCHRSPLLCTAKGLCRVFFCSNFTV